MFTKNLSIFKVWVALPVDILQVEGKKDFIKIKSLLKSKTFQAWK